MHFFYKTECRTTYTSLFIEERIIGSCASSFLATNCLFWMIANGHPGSTIFIDNSNGEATITDSAFHGCNVTNSLESENQGTIKLNVLKGITKRACFYLSWSDLYGQVIYASTSPSGILELFLSQIFCCPPDEEGKYDCFYFHRGHEESQENNMTHNKLKEFGMDVLWYVQKGFIDQLNTVAFNEGYWTLMVCSSGTYSGKTERCNFVGNAYRTSDVGLVHCVVAVLEICDSVLRENGHLRAISTNDGGQVIWSRNSLCSNGFDAKIVQTSALSQCQTSMMLTHLSCKIRTSIFSRMKVKNVALSLVFGWLWITP